MLYKVNDILRYDDGLDWEGLLHRGGYYDRQLSLYHRYRANLNGEIAIVLKVGEIQSPAYFCYVAGKKLWVVEEHLHKPREEDENEKKNS